MPDRSHHNEPHPTLPSSFFECLIRDIPTDTWLRLLSTNFTLKAAVFEGFTVPANKLGRLLRQPHIVARLRRFIRSEIAIFDEILQIWGQEQLAVMAFMEMLDPSFLIENFRNLKNFIGPERFFAGLHLLGYLEDKDFQKLIGEGFWTRQIDSELMEPLAPLWHLWNDFVQQYPQAEGWFENGQSVTKEKPEAIHEEPRQALCKQLHSLEERCSKLQTKLNKAEEEKSQLQQEATRYRKEHEEFKKQLAESERMFGTQLEESLARMRAEWFQRYQTLDITPLEKAAGLLDSLLRRTERAFDLQRQADEEYGSVAAVRQKLAHVEMYLKEIERIYADSLVVHSEVARAKGALLDAKQKLLKLPGIGKVLGQEPALITAVDMRRQIRLLDAVPENLPKVSELHVLLTRFVDLGFIEDPQSILQDIEHKKRQIMESLYAQYQTFQVKTSHHRHFRNLEDFVESGESKKYDVYVDGYNVLLKLQGQDRSSSPLGLTASREQFAAAVVRRSRHFRKVYLVFDGREDSRYRQGNTEIIYTDKSRGNTADAHIIQAVQKAKDRKVLLVTEDQEIIQAVEDRLYAVVNSYHFYMFVNDLPFPQIL
jgi:predicted RNA-binding protein with PIN domain